MSVKHWQLLEEDRYKEVWDYIYGDLRFYPNDSWEKLLRLPSPKIAWDISSFYDNGFREDLYEDLHAKALSVMRSCTFGNQEIIALSWQHECYRFDPRLPMDMDDFGEWLIPVFPNGDYNFFLREDLSNGIVCDGISLVIACYGEEFTEALKRQLPDMLKLAPTIE